MNIFWLSLNPNENAELYNNEHLIKIILEICQCLFSALHHHGRVYEDDSWQNGMTKVYRQAHKHHPVVLWLTEHPNNYRAACVQALALCAEYTKRRNKVHACECLIYELMQRIPLNEIDVPFKPECVRATINIPSGCTPVPCCMEKHYIVYDTSGAADLTASYINFYRKTKLRFKSGRICTWPSVPALFADDYASIIQ